MYIHTYICTYIHTYFVFVCVCVCACVCVSLCVLGLKRLHIKYSWNLTSEYSQMLIFVSALMCTCDVCTYVSMHGYVYTCTHAKHLPDVDTADH